MTIRGRMLAERERIESKFDERERVLRKFTAVIGDGEGNVYPDPSNLQYNFIRRTGRSRIERVRNTRVQAVHGLRVWVGFTPERPDEMQVIDIDDTAYGNALGVGSFLSDHHQQHELHTVGGGGDTTWIWAQQFLHLLCQVTDPISEFLQVRIGIYAYNGAYYIFPGATTVDLTTYAPGAGLAVMVLVSIVAGTGNLVYTTSGPFTSALPSDLWPSQVPITPDGTLPVGAVYVPNGATTFDWDYVLDWRIFVNVVGDVQPHNIFSTSHPDTLPDTIVRGDLATGLDTVPPRLGRLPLGTALEILRVNAGGTDVEWSDVLEEYVLRSEWLQNGFVDETEVSLAWNDGTRTLTVDSVGANFNYFHDGLLYTRTGPDTETIADTEGMWVFYYDGATLSSLYDPTHAQIDNIFENECLVAYVYWDAANNDGRLMYELHGYRMSPVTHHWIHDSIGSVYRSGMALADFVIDDTGADDEDAQFSVAQGEFYDEDIQNELAAVGKLVGLEIWYLNIADWRWTTNAGFSILVDGVTGRMAYNNAGAQAAVGNNNFALCHIYATNIVDDAGANPKYIAIQGQAQYNTINNARDGADTEINALTFGSLPLQELVPVGTIIFQTANAYGNAVQSRTRTTGSGDNYVDWRGTSIKAAGGSVASHSALADLNVPGDHPAYIMHDGTRPMTGDLNIATHKVLLDVDGEIFSSGDDLYVKNVTLDQDIYFQINDGGVTKTPIFLRGSTGDVGINEMLNPTAPLHVLTESVVPAGNSFILDKYASIPQGVGLNFRRARGTLAIPLDLISTDTVSVMRSRVYVNGAFQVVSNIQILAQTVGALVSSGQLSIKLADTAGALQSRLDIDEDGNAGINQPVPLDVLHVEGAVLREGWFCGYAAAQAGFDGTLTDIDIDTEIREDATYYTHAAGSDNITVIESGWYRISYTVNVENTGNDRAAHRVRIFDDGAAIVHSASQCYTRDGTASAANQFGRYGTCTSSFLVEIAAGSVIDMRTDGFEGAGDFGDADASYTVLEGSQITIERVDE